MLFPVPCCGWELYAEKEYRYLSYNVNVDFGIMQDGTRRCAIAKLS